MLRYEWAEERNACFVLVVVVQLYTLDVRRSAVHDFLQAGTDSDASEPSRSYNGEDIALTDTLGQSVRHDSLSEQAPARSAAPLSHYSIPSSRWTFLAVETYFGVEHDVPE